jgi:serine/threonine protein kinase/Tfp pilus assembly protein PilF
MADSQLLVPLPRAESVRTVQFSVTTGEAAGLAERLAEEMARRWRDGERPLAEEFFARHPSLPNHPQAAVRLIYEEVRLRQGLGQEVAQGEVLARFPQWRAQLEVLFDCRSLAQPGPDDPFWQLLQEALPDFRLVAELGRGAAGRVVLAAQTALADRLVVLKVTSCHGHEHLSLARLQHTHIVPLYWMQDDPARNLRVLCMPYFGGMTLDRLLAALRVTPPGRRSGQQLLDRLDQARPAALLTLPAKGPARQLLARASYVQAVCWIGACLADALHYAHERGLVHLDLKPSNVLLAADGQPMLLDFHLAREPLPRHGPVPDWFGGTPEYMAPEQRLALAAVRERRPVPEAVDGRADLYSLGLLLYEALGGPLPGPNSNPAGLPRLDRCNPQVSVGLADLLHKCLAPAPAGRYRDAGALAADLRRHLTDLPLRGVANRSWTERWRKWRRRRPHALALYGLGATLLAVLGMAAACFMDYLGQRHGEAQAILEEGRQRLHGREYAEAARTLARGLALARGLPGGPELAQAFDEQLRLAKRAQAAQDLHALADRIRFLAAQDALSSRQLQVLEGHCRKVWDARGLLTDRGAAGLAPDLEQQLQTDLLDLALLWLDLRLRLAPGPRADETRRAALAVLAEAEALFGPSLVLLRERQAHAAALGLTGEARSAERRAAGLAPRTAWEHYALGRSHLRAGDLESAAVELERALDLQPQGFWPNFYQGLCAYRLRHYEDAAGAFRVCVALAPGAAECFYNRALAQAALGHPDRALHDYNRALQLDPGQAAAALNRGILHYEGRRSGEALADFQRALDHGADPAAVHYNRALVHLARDDRIEALASLDRALAHDPGHAEARDLRERLRRER